MSCISGNTRVWSEKQLKTTLIKADILLRKRKIIQLKIRQLIMPKNKQVISKQKLSTNFYLQTKLIFSINTFTRNWLHLIKYFTQNLLSFKRFLPLDFIKNTLA